MFKLVLILIVALPLVLLAAGQLGLLRGHAPTNLGVQEGRLKGLSATPNCVSSQAGLYPDHTQMAYASIDPLPLKNGDAAASLATLTRVLEGMDGMTLVDQKPGYVYAQAETRWLKFTDDVEFWVNPTQKVIDVRSASRIGRKDFAANRIRVEAIRAAYLAAS